jgi:hypothetical protein
MELFYRIIYFYIFKVGIFLFILDMSLMVETILVMLLFGQIVQDIFLELNLHMFMKVVLLLAMLI